MNPTRHGPMSYPGGRSSGYHIHLDPAIHPQDSRNPCLATGLDATQRALAFLEILQQRQSGLRRPTALAWERVVFAEVFDHPDPGRTISRFLDKT